MRLPTRGFGMLLSARLTGAMRCSSFPSDARPLSEADVISRVFPPIVEIDRRLFFHLRVAKGCECKKNSTKQFRETRNISSNLERESVNEPHNNIYAGVSRIPRTTGLRRNTVRRSTILRDKDNNSVQERKRYIYVYIHARYRPAATGYESELIPPRRYRC